METEATSIDQRIDAAVRRVPPGYVTTYGRIAAMIGHPGSARRVGYALHRGPRDLPWHRVINAAGRISLAAHSTAALTQRRRLEDEGVVFTGDRIDLGKYGYGSSDMASNSD